ncbi:hypothetical protein CEP48_05065 [Mergibacter septicus]|uniref:Uncharacterized protein n=1 Tax=Mergibacter septicus TaxID=221402 RepID=A0A8E3MHC6_9PAST|nr:hypothetical protein [Mergibacter septicus]AWX15580.1 hypothetical protein CEP47_05065 [Mergibacter septicus]QDJ13056.1 hypothetical protein CEP45_03960 [Mergibacter septicus]QDJ14834.1 hypothetical protein CEP48_05065 [Mergibacter septicus]UTU47738.1 hypothetical protein HLL31_02520 [Mergibacter septicus]WMR96656.1 hypothetical protein RDJ12_03615 [Mergibacter septicus]
MKNDFKVEKVEGINGQNIWAYIAHCLNKSKFQAERQFENLDLNSRKALARVAEVEFKRHLREYNDIEKRKIGRAVRMMKHISKAFCLKVCERDFLNIDDEVNYAD